MKKFIVEFIGTFFLVFTVGACVVNPAPGVIAPLAFSTFYFVVQRAWPGAVWLLVVAANVLVVPLIALGARTARDAH